MNDLTILLAEDNLGDQMLVQKAIDSSDRGTTLKIVSDGQEALDYLYREEKYRNAPKPTLIMLDLNLPRKSGPEVLAEIRKDPILKDIPVVLITGAKPTPQMAAIAELNPNFYVVKPDGIEAFFAVVSAIEEYAWSMLNIPKRQSQHANKLRQRTAA